MKFLKNNANVILLCLFEAFIGILLLVNPVEFTSAIIIAFGIAMAAAGLICIIGYFRTSAEEAALSGMLVKGLAMMIAGIFCMSQPKLLIAAFPLVTILYGIVILFAGLCKVQWTVDALRLKIGRWFLPALSALVSVVCSCVILSNPFVSTLALWMFVGISLIVEAVLDVVVLIFSRINMY